MWLVQAALRNPYTVWVGMLVVAVLGVLSYQRTPTDILPNLKAPVVVVFASYRGMPAPDMEQSVTAILERALTRCDHLDHIESRSLLGIGIIKVCFRPEVNPDVAASQVVSFVSGELQNLPPGSRQARPAIERASPCGWSRRPCATRTPSGSACSSSPSWACSATSAPPPTSCPT